MSLSLFRTGPSAARPLGRCAQCSGRPVLPTHNPEIDTRRCVRCQGERRWLPQPHPDNHLCEVCARECLRCQALTSKADRLCRACQGLCRICNNPVPEPADGAPAGHPRRPGTAQGQKASLAKDVLRADLRSGPVRELRVGRFRGRPAPGRSGEPAAQAHPCRRRWSVTRGHLQHPRPAQVHAPRCSAGSRRPTLVGQMGHRAGEESRRQPGGLSSRRCRTVAAGAALVPQPVRRRLAGGLRTRT